jgi:hypothetical protein
MAFRSADQEFLNDFVFCPRIHMPSVFRVDPYESTASHCILVGGFNSALSLYNLGGKHHIEEFGKLVGGKKEKSGSIFTKALSLFASSSDKKNDKSQQTAKLDGKTVTMNAQVNFQDGKRRIIRLSMDPTGQFVAAADALGRVTLFSTSCNCVVRLWKGYRDARLAWTHAANAAPQNALASAQRAHTVLSTSHVSSGGGLPPTAAPPYSASVDMPGDVCMAIYAPLLGLVSIFRTPHGPCLRCIPVGLQCQVHTFVDVTARSTR